MSEEEDVELKKTPKKTVKKAAAKKGAKKAPRKKVVQKDSDPVADKDSSPKAKDSSSAEKSEESKGRSKADGAESTISVVEESPAEASEERSQESRGPKRRVRGSRRGGNRDGERPERGPKRPIDAQEASAKAWEIFQGELEEEGVSLVDARRGRELARRCLELATVFCEERDSFIHRQKRATEKPKPQKEVSEKKEDLQHEQNSEADAEESAASDS